MTMRPANPPATYHYPLTTAFKPSMPVGLQPPCSHSLDHRQGHCLEAVFSLHWRLYVDTQALATQAPVIVDQVLLLTSVQDYLQIQPDTKPSKTGPIRDDYACLCRNSTHEWWKGGRWW